MSKRNEKSTMPIDPALAELGLRVVVLHENLARLGGGVRVTDDAIEPWAPARVAGRAAAIVAVWEASL